VVRNLNSSSQTNSTECGYQVFLTDLGRWSYIFGLIRETISLASFFLSLLSQLRAEQISFEINNKVHHDSGTKHTHIQNTIYSNDFNNVLSLIGDTFGTLSIALATLPTFPDASNHIFTKLGINLENLFAFYKCDDD